MASFTPAVLALVFGSLIAIAGLVPWAAVQYRRRGGLGFGNTVLAFITVVYALALVTYTLLPLPDTSDVAVLCRSASGPQLRLFAFVGDIAKEGGLSGPRSLLANPAAAQVIFNVILFVPLGMLVRHLFLHGRFLAGVISGTVVGFAVSLLIEFTQLTGDWFLYPCAYRLFDVDDLFANTLGALVGTLISPVLVIFVRNRASTTADVARPVTRTRRAFGMFCDLLAITLTSGATGVDHEPRPRAGEPGPAVDDRDRAAGDAAVRGAGDPARAGPGHRAHPGGGRGATPSHAAARPVAASRAVGRRVRRLGDTTAATFPLSGVLAFALAVAALIGLVATRERRGFANALARLDVVDDRVDADERAAEESVR